MLKKVNYYWHLGNNIVFIGDLAIDQWDLDFVRLIARNNWEFMRHTDVFEDNHVSFLNEIIEC